jgi:hypothetical protein
VIKSDSKLFHHRDENCILILKMLQDNFDFLLRFDVHLKIVLSPHAGEGLFGVTACHVIDGWRASRAREDVGPLRLFPHRGFFPWRLSDAGRRRMSHRRGRPTSETLHRLGHSGAVLAWPLFHKLQTLLRAECRAASGQQRKWFLFVNRLCHCRKS